MTPLHCYEPRPGAALRLFCFPHAGGNAAFFRLWHRTRHDLEVRAVQYPGRADRAAEPFADDVQVLAKQLAEAVAPLLDRPAVLFGHSLGALIAYEVTHALRAMGRAPAALVVSGRHAAHDHRGTTTFTGSDDDLVAELARLGGSAPELLADPEIRRLALPAVRHDYRLDETYAHRHDRPLDRPVLALIGADDPEVSPGQAARWGELTTGPFTQRSLPGDHFYLADRRADVLRAVLATVPPPTP
ncbi:thioesterase II family protein [Nonomuraea typhae]|uniref:thioesterase II family protein n=1 Tax=Nonomuraea typhae TaxID=2603600 RepID=UPI0012FBC1FA|nr:alpha/beta fold hydrolase [Nonomuraea typhae]